MTRIELINMICAHVDAKDYLEIGIRDGMAISQIQAANRTGVDPNPLTQYAHPSFSGGLDGVRVFPCESDVFFEKDHTLFDVVFVDGLHLYEQAIKDVFNAVNCLRSRGYIVVHDLLPTTREEGARIKTTDVWNGDVWKIMHDLHHNYPAIQSFVVDSDCGMGVIWIDDPDVHFEPVWTKGYPRLPFSVYEEEKHVFMDIIPPDRELLMNKLNSRLPVTVIK